jgi:acetyl esterase/lipase
MFLDEDISYAQAMLRAGVPVELHVYPGAFHGSDTMVPHADASQRWRRDEMAALRRALGVTG